MKNSKALKKLLALVAAVCTLNSCAGPTPTHETAMKVEEKEAFDPNNLGTDEQKSVDACTRRIEKNPKEVAAYMERAATYGSVPKLCQKAIADYTTVIKLDPNNAEAYDSRGKAYASLHANTDAVDDLTKAIDDFTKAIGIVLTSRLKKDRAMDDVVDLYSCYTDRGDAFFALHHDLQAIQDYKIAVIVSPTDPKAYAKLGDCYRGLGRHEQAIDSYTNAIKWNRETWETATSHRAQEYLAVRQYNKALDDCNRIIEADKADAKTYLLRAEIYKVMGRSDKAQVDIEKAEAMKPSPNATENINPQ